MFRLSPLATDSQTLPRAFCAVFRIFAKQLLMNNKHVTFLLPTYYINRKK